MISQSKSGPCCVSPDPSTAYTFLLRTQQMAAGRRVAPVRPFSSVLRRWKQMARSYCSVVSRTHALAEALNKQPWGRAERAQMHWYTRALL